MAYVSPGAGKLAYEFDSSRQTRVRQNCMYTPLNLLDNSITQTAYDDETGSDVTVTTSDAINDLDNFFKTLVTNCLKNNTYIASRVSYTGIIYSGEGTQGSKAYGGDDIEDEDIETPKSEGEEIIDLKGDKKNG